LCNPLEARWEPEVLAGRIPSMWGRRLNLLHITLKKNDHMV
jgi:hypothetical protein